MERSGSEEAVPGRTGSAAEVFAAFLKLGLTSFGGPIAHLGYFRREFVEQRKWVSDHDFGQLLALCQFLPGPASSQLGFTLGLLRGGLWGALAAFVGFTLALYQMSIWYKRSWSLTIKATVDGLIYALLTAGTFGWLWPH